MPSSAFLRRGPETATTWEDRLRCARPIKTITAKFDSVCPSCQCEIPEGTSVSMATNAPEGCGGRWECSECAEDHRVLYAYGHHMRAPFIDQKASDAQTLRLRPWHMRMHERAAYVMDANQEGA